MKLWWGTLILPLAAGALPGCTAAIEAEIQARAGKIYADLLSKEVTGAQRAIAMAQKATDPGPPAPAARVACYQAVLADAQARQAAGAPELPTDLLTGVEFYFEGRNAAGAGLTGIIPVPVHDACAPLVLTILQRAAKDAANLGLSLPGLPKLP
jgi:hypothetical protein